MFVLFLCCIDFVLFCSYCSVCVVLTMIVISYFNFVCVHACVMYISSQIRLYGTVICFIFVVK